MVPANVEAAVGADHHLIDVRHARRHPTQADKATVIIEDAAIDRVWPGAVPASVCRLVRGIARAIQKAAKRSKVNPTLFMSVFSSFFHLFLKSRSNAPG
jgi:hypothetical protein